MHLRQDDSPIRPPKRNPRTPGPEQGSSPSHISPAASHLSPSHVPKSHTSPSLAPSTDAPQTDNIAAPAANRSRRTQLHDPVLRPVRGLASSRGSRQFPEWGKDVISSPDVSDDDAIRNKRMGGENARGGDTHGSTTRSETTLNLRARKDASTSKVAWKVEEAFAGVPKSLSCFC